MMRIFIRWCRNPVSADVMRGPQRGNRTEAVMRNLLMLCAVLAVGPAFAQDEDSSSGGGGGARAAGGGGGKAKAGPQTIDFEDDTIEGDLTKPDGEYVEARSKVQHSNLIRIREDFEDKVMQSVGEL
jgi:hypothetical protein